MQVETLLRYVLVRSQSQRPDLIRWAKYLDRGTHGLVIHTLDHDKTEKLSGQHTGSAIELANIYPVQSNNSQTTLAVASHFPFGGCYSNQSLMDIPMQKNFGLPYGILIAMFDQEPRNLCKSNADLNGQHIRVSPKVMTSIPQRLSLALPSQMLSRGYCIVDGGIRWLIRERRRRHETKTRQCRNNSLSKRNSTCKTHFVVWVGPTSGTQCDAHVVMDSGRSISQVTFLRVLHDVVIYVSRFLDSFCTALYASVTTMEAHCSFP